jgi:phosphonate transport system substrate-binding protein
MIKRILCHLLILAALLPLEQALAAGNYKLSMLPRYSPEEISRRITPLAEHLATKLNARVEPVVASDFQEYEQRLQRGDIKIGYENPYVYVRVSDQQEVLAMASKGKDGNRFRGIIITRADSDIVEMSDLKGKAVSIVSKSSAGGFLSQKVTLQKYGLDVNRDLQLEEALDNKQENVIFSVYYGDVDAGFIRESALNKVASYVPQSQIRVIKRTAWLPNWALSVSRSLPPDIKNLIKNTVLGLGKDHAVLNALKIDNFLPASDADYDVMRQAAGLPIPHR